MMATWSPSLPPALRWLDSEFFPQGAKQVAEGPQQATWQRYTAFTLIHLACLAVLWVGTSPVAVGVAILLLWIRMFAVTGFYHRYFSHRTYRTSRVFQFLMALIGGTALQRGALWWASNHRHHHRFSDMEQDLHSPKQRGFWWAHMGWLACPANMPTHYKRIPDLAQFPELVWLNHFDWVPPSLLAIGLFILGEALPASLGTSGPQMLIWGFFISSVVLFHCTWTINSISHQWGTRRFNTTDTSRNNFILAILTMGEGWHNNHHAYQGTVRQGFYWWEIDMTFYGLWLLSKLGLVWDLHPVPAAAYQRAEANKKARKQGLPLSATPSIGPSLKPASLKPTAPLKPAHQV
jgi:stearoyl-CoA desaturase (delta-9 desaturase)